MVLCGSLCAPVVACRRTEATREEAAENASAVVDESAAEDVSRTKFPLQGTDEASVRSTRASQVLGVARAAAPTTPTTPTPGATSVNAGGASDARRTADVFFTTSVDGYIEPCGCTTRPLGGLQRLATVVRRGAPARGLIDAGNLLFPSSKILPETRAQHRLKASLLVRAYQQLGALAINFSEGELVEGAEFLSELQHDGAVRFVSANVRPIRREGGPSVARSFLHDVGGIKIGVTGVSTPERVAATGARVSVIEYAPPLSAEVNALRARGAEVVLVLANIGDKAARTLATSVPGIDVLVRSPGSAIEFPVSAPERVAGVLIVEAGSQGQYVGRLSIHWGAEAPPRPFVFDDGALVGAKQRAMIERRLKAYAVEIEAWAKDPAKAEAVRGRRAQMARLQASLNSGLKSAAPPPTGPYIGIDVIPLGTEVPADPTLVQMLRGYYDQLQALNLEKGDQALCKPTKDSPAVYVGSEVCQSCHEEAFAFWKTTKHARAWATLEDEGKHFDLTCIGCHTVGYRKPGGFCRLKDLGVLKDVGCENCHGPGSLHVGDQKAESITLETTKSTCDGHCHVPEHSDGFAYEEYLSRITGPGHQRRPRAP
ncbi:MAG: hypothetical protein H6729_00710 [Deltaproteobacteria bacterium]|nr:hypothetical protein [Deltaproteobacteria bacterium]